MAQAEEIDLSSVTCQLLVTTVSANTFATLAGSQAWIPKRLSENEMGAHESVVSVWKLACPEQWLGELS